MSELGELYDPAKLLTLRNRGGIQFADWCKEHEAEKSEMVIFSFKNPPSDPQSRSQDNDKTLAYIARVAYLLNKARAFHLSAKGIVFWSLKKAGHPVTFGESLTKAICSDFAEEEGDWESMLDALHERLWTGRREVDVQNRVGVV